jgi:predicted GNAT family acetyltransferase
MTPEEIKRLCPEFCLLIDEWSGGKNIPAFLVVKALAEARQALGTIHTVCTQYHSWSHSERVKHAIATAEKYLPQPPKEGG